MIWIHFLILAVFCVFFFLTSGIHVTVSDKDSALLKPFLRLSVFLLRHLPVHIMESARKKQALLNPAGARMAETKRYFAGKLSEALCLLFVGNLLGLVLTAASLGESGKMEYCELERNDCGEGDRQVTLEARIDGEALPEGLQVTVGERRYSAGEIQEIFEEIGNRLEEEILGQNESADRIEYNLRLLSSVGGYPVEITWETSDYDVMDGEGHIQEAVTDRRGTLITLRALLDYYDAHAEYEFPLRVYPAKRSGAEEARAAILRKISRYDASTVSEESLILPSDIGGAEITWYRPAARGGLYILLMSILAAVVIYCGRDRELDRRIADREREMMLDYPEIVSKLNLLFGAGMTIRGAFEKISGDYEKRKRNGRCPERYAYEELLVTVREMQSGKSEFQAYQNYGTRSGVRHYNKLGALLAQNLRKGSAGLLQLLEAEAKEAFEERKSLARKLGEEAGTKLLLPMGIMLLIVMVIVIVPAFLSFSL